MTNIYKSFKEVSLIIAGALIGVLAIPFENEIKTYIPLFIITIIICILYGIGFFKGIYTLLIKISRIINNYKKTVLIYAPYDVDTETSSWINISLRQIENELKNSNINYVVGIDEKSIYKYPFTINPYGGVYPENNLSDLKSLELIFDYVRNGGVYINIADIPFYYAYDQNLQRRVDTTPLAGDFKQFRSFLQTLLTRKLHCFVFGLTSGGDFNKGITRVIELSTNTNNLFDHKVLIDGNKPFSPQLKIPYGKGYFIFSTIELTHENLDILIKLVKINV